MGNKIPGDERYTFKRFDYLRKIEAEAKINIPYFRAQIMWAENLGFTTADRKQLTEAGQAKLNQWRKGIV